MKNYLLCLTLMAGFSAHLLAGTITVAPDTPTVSGPFGVNVLLSGFGANVAPSVSGVSFDLTFDPSILSFTGAFAFGDPSLNPANQLALKTVGAGDAQQNSPGDVSTYFVSFDATADLVNLQADTFRLVRLTFAPVGLGVSPLSIANLSILDENNPPNDMFGMTTVRNSSVTATPETSTAGLIMTGLAAVLIFRTASRSRSAVHLS